MERDVQDLMDRRLRQMQTAAGVGTLGLLDGALVVTGHMDRSLCDYVINLTPLPWDGSAVLALACAGVATLAGRSRKQAETAQAAHRRNLRRLEWGYHSSYRAEFSMARARKIARGPRQDLQRWQIRTAKPSALGIPVGTTLSGPRRRDRGCQVLVPWEEAGLLIMGTQGTRKSTILSGMVADVPGPMLAVSTKDELMRGCHRATARKGRNFYLDASGVEAGEVPAGVQPFRYNLLQGCENSTRAQALAVAMVDASGLAKPSGDEGGFWRDISEGLITALLQAAAIRGLRATDLLSWINKTDWEEPEKILIEAYRAGTHDVQKSVFESFATLKDPNMAKQSGSAAITAKTCFAWLNNGPLVAQLDADPAEAVDLAEFLRNRSTLYVMSGDTLPLSPILAAVWSDLTNAGRAVATAAGHREKRLSPPLVLAVDEADVTLPGLDLSEITTKQRGEPGVFTIAVTQNRARMIAKLGRERAEAWMSGFSAHLVMRVDDPDSREYYEKKSRTRTRVEATTSKNRPDDVASKVLGNPLRRGHSTTNSNNTDTVPLWDRNMWSTEHLDTLQGVLFLGGSQCVVQCPNGREVADKLGAKTPAAYATREWAAATGEQDEAEREAANRIADETRAWHAAVQQHRETQRGL